MIVRTHTSKQLRYFRDAALTALESLQERFGMALWVVKCGDDEPIVLQVRDHSIGLDVEGLQYYCHVAASLGPKIEPAVDEASELAGTDTARRLKVGAYIGVPLQLDDGTQVGTLCALDSEKQPESLRANGPEIVLVARLLATTFVVETRFDELLRRVERTEAELTVDSDTGLFTMEGWLFLMQAEEQRCVRYGRPAGAIVIRLEDESATDQAVKDAGEVVSRATRQTDVAARIGNHKLGLLVLETPAGALPKVVDRLDGALAARGIDAMVGFAARDPAVGFRSAIAEAEAMPAH